MVSASSIINLTLAFITFMFALCSANRKVNGKIAFSRVMKNGNIELFDMNPDGKNLKQLTYSDRFSSQAPIVNAHPSFSANGTLFAFTSTRNGNANLFIMTSDGSNVQQVTRDSGESEVPNFSPDAKRIAFSGSRGGSFEIFTINVDGNRLRQLTFNNATNDGPKYTPDGKYIVFSSDVNGSGSPRNRDLYIMDALTGKNLRRLTYGMDNRFSRSISPDGKRIVFSSTKDNVGNLFIMNIDGSNLKQITNATGNGSGYSPLPGWPVFNGAITPAWSPDGKEIAFADNSSGEYRIYKFSLKDNSNCRKYKQLTSNGNDLSVGWQPILVK